MEDTEGLDAALEAINEDQTLGRYELLTPVGRGGMAIVWAARLQGTRGFSKFVAIKTMLPVLSADPRFEKMFLAEAEIASRIKHPNVCAIHDLGEDNGVLYLVMDWIDGEPLSTLLRISKADDVPIPYPIAAAIIAAAARGLHAAHEPLGIIHRDVSPQNILVDHDGLVRIVDFGVAKAAQRSDQVTQSGFIKGKVAYLAPEQVQSPEIDARADVFALGVVLYEMVAGRHPFRGGTELDTLLRIASTDPPPPVEDEEFPARLRLILERALAKNRDDRYASMRELAGDLEAFADDASTEAIASFVNETLHTRREARADELREAIRHADERAERRKREASIPKAKSLRPTPNRRRTFASIAIVGIAGVGIGAIGVQAASRTTPTTPSSSSTIVAEPAVQSAQSSATPKPPITVAEDVPPVAPSAKSTTTSRPTAKPAVVKSEQPMVAPAPAISSGPPPARFRQPGF